MATKKARVKSKKRGGTTVAKSRRRTVRTAARKPARRAGTKPSQKRSVRSPKRSVAKPTRPPKSAAPKSAAPKATAPKATASKKPRGATAADILNLAVSAPARRPAASIPAKWMRHHRNLERLRDELLFQSGQLSRDAHEEGVRHSMHMADSGTDSFDRDFALSLLSADQEAIREIDEAIKRIEEGTYGICQMTGKPIGKARLEAIPWTRFSYEAQSRLEREGMTNHTHLGSLGSVYTGDNWEPSEGEEEEEEPAAPEKS